MGTGGSKDVEKEMSWRVDQDWAVDGQCFWIANVADAVDRGLAEAE